MECDRRKTSCIFNIPRFCWPVLVPVVLSWVPHMRVVYSRFSFGDEGLVAQGAYRVYQGQVPFRDFFSALVPASYYWSASLFGIMGPSMFSLRSGVVIVSLVLLLASWFVLARSGIRSFTVYMVPAAFLAYYGGPCWFVASHHWLAAALSMVSLALLMPSDGDETPSMLSSATSGVFSALAMLTLQHRGGLWILCSSLVFLSLPRVRCVRLFVAYWLGIASCAVPVAVYFVTKTGLGVLYYDLMVFPLTRYNGVEAHRGTLLNHLAEFFRNASFAWQNRTQSLGFLRFLIADLELVGILIVYLLPIAGACLLWWLRKSRVYSMYQIGCLTAFFVSSYLSTFHRLSSSTLIFSASSSVIILALSLDVIRKKVDSSAAVVRSIIVTWMVICAVTATLYSFVVFASPKVTVATPAGDIETLYVNDADTLQGIASFASGNWKDGDTVFCYPYAALFYFLFRLNNPTPYDIITWPMNTESQYDNAKSILQQNSNRWVVVSTERPRFRDSISLERYLAEHYSIIRSFKGAAILERIP